MKNKSKWILIVFILSFILSIIFSGISTAMAESFNTIILAIIILVVIGIGIIFDMIGVAVLTCKESNLHYGITIFLCNILKYGFEANC